MKPNVHSKSRLSRNLPVLILAALVVQGCEWNDTEYEKYVSKNKVSTCSFNLMSLNNGRYIRKVDTSFYCGDYNAVGLNETPPTTFICNDNKEIAKAKEAMERGYCVKEAFHCVRQLIDDHGKIVKTDNASMCSEYDEGVINCSGKSVNIINDVNNCGGCGNRCDEDKQSCKDGMCKDFEATCAGINSISCTLDGEIKCIDKAGSETCGATSCDEGGLGTACEGDLICLNENGICGCPPGMVKTGNRCLDSNNPNTCGARVGDEGEKCDENQTCIEGHCICNTGLVKCGKKCVSSDSKEYCGADENCQRYSKCSENEECVNGVCLCSGSNGGANDMAKCGDTCVPRLSISHCGALGLCNETSSSSKNFTGYRCDNIGKNNCLLKGDAYECECNNGEAFDTTDGQCKKNASNSEFCGDEKLNCKLIYGDKAICENGLCGCDSGWLKVDSSFNTWGKDWDFDENFRRCVNPNFDKRFCGATEGKRVDAENGIRSCNDDEMCIDGKCENADHVRCEKLIGGGGLCKNNQCLNFTVNNMRSCKECKDGFCSLDKDVQVEGCHGVLGKNCGCGEGYIMAYNENNKQWKCEKTKELHVIKGEARISSFVCQDGWANSNTKYQEYDGSFDATDSDGCEINIDSDVSNCGEVGNICADSDAVRHLMYSQCIEGKCSFQSCAYDDEHNYADCNGDFNLTDGNGCEVDLFLNKNNCGSCNNKCNGGRVCKHGTCCFDDTITTDAIKLNGCCTGLQRYRKCVSQGPFNCWNYHYQCASPEANLDEGWVLYNP